MKLPHTDSVLVCVRARERCYLYLIVMPVFLEGLDPNIQCETMKHYQYPGQKHCAFWIIPSRPVPICVCVSHHNEKTAFVGPSGREQEPGYYCFMPDELKRKLNIYRIGFSWAHSTVSVMGRMDFSYWIRHILTPDRYNTTLIYLLAA